MCVDSCDSQSLRSGAVRRSMSGPACWTACLVSPSTLYVYPAPRGQRHSSCVRACAQTTATAAPYCNTTSQHQQRQQQRSFASVIPSLGTAAGKPCSCCCGGQDVSHSSCNTVDATLSGKIRHFLLIILTSKPSFNLRTYWSKE